VSGGIDCLFGTVDNHKVFWNNSAVTYSGTWTLESAYGGTKLYGTLAVGATATISLPSSSTIDVVTVHQRGNTSDYSISIDGVAQINPLTGTNLWNSSIDFTTNNGVGYAPYLHHFANLANTPHTVVLTSQHIVLGFPNYFLWAQATSPGQNGTDAPSVYVGTIPQSTTAAYAGSPAGIGPTNVSLFNNEQFHNVKEMAAAGINVSGVDISSTNCFNPNAPGQAYIDGIHPTALGDTYIASCYEKAMLQAK
jgi:hypothetical protein